MTVWNFLAFFVVGTVLGKGWIDLVRRITKKRDLAEEAETESKEKPEKETATQSKKEITTEFRQKPEDNATTKFGQKSEDNAATKFGQKSEEKPEEKIENGGKTMGSFDVKFTKDYKLHGEYSFWMEFKDGDDKISGFSYERMLRQPQQHYNSPYDGKVLKRLIRVDEMMAVAYDDLAETLRDYEINDLQKLLQRCFDSYSTNRPKVADLMESIYLGDAYIRKHAEDQLADVAKDNQRILEGVEKFVTAIKSFVAQTKRDETPEHITDMTAVAELEMLSDLITQIQSGELAGVKATENCDPWQILFGKTKEEVIRTLAEADEQHDTLRALLGQSDERQAKQLKTLLGSYSGPIGILDKQAEVPTIDFESVLKAQKT